MTVGLASIAVPAPFGFPVGLDGTKTFFVDQYGNPCLAIGDAPQILPNMLSDENANFYFNDRITRGVNIVWLIPPDNAFQTSPPNNFYGNAPFSGADFTNFNEAFWLNIDFLMNRCAAGGVTVLFNVAFIGLGIGGVTDGYKNSWKAASDAVLQGYASFLGARYGKYRNLIWLLGGDADPNDATLYAKLNTFAVALAAADTGAHLMTLEACRVLEGGGNAPNGGYSSVDAHILAYGSVQSWLTMNWVYQTGPTILSGSQRCYQQSGLPGFLGEDWYELEHTSTTTPQFLRGEGYYAIAGGCTLGRSMGNGAIWPFNSSNGDPSVVQSWQSQLSSPASLGNQYLGKLFRSRSFQKLVPDLTNVVMTAGSSNNSACTRTSDGISIVAYVPTSQTITIDMSKITDAGSQANCNWYDPTSGAVTNIGTFANTGTKTFTTPGSNSTGDGDWGLVIDSHAANLRTPGT